MKWSGEPSTNAFLIEVGYEVFSVYGQLGVGVTEQ